MRVCIEQEGERIWSHGEGHGEASLSYLYDGRQETIIAALTEALEVAQGQLSFRLKETNVVAYVRRTAAQV
jgi:hypothetical protein